MADFALDNPYITDIDLDRLHEYLSGKSTSGISGEKGRARERAYELYYNALNYEAELALMQREQDYNSPAAQVARLRAAGINPDLAGIDSSNVSPASYDAMSSQTIGQDIKRMSAVSGVIGSAVQSAAQMVQTINSVRANELQLRGMELDNYNKQMSNMSTENQVFMDYLYNTMSSEDLSNFLSDQSGSLFPSFDIDDFALYTGLDQDSSKHFLNTMQERIKSPAGKAALSKMFRQYAENKKAYDEIVSDPRYQDSYDPNQAMKEYTSLRVDALKWYEKYQSALNEYQTNYFQNLDSSIAAGAVNSENAYTKAFNESADPTLAGESQNAGMRMQGIVDELKSALLNKAHTLLELGDPIATEMGVTLYQLGLGLNMSNWSAILNRILPELAAKGGNIIDRLVGTDNPMSGQMQTSVEPYVSAF